MLNSQLEHKKFQFLDFNPKVEISGISVGANVRAKNNGGLIDDTLSVIEKLNKKKFVKRLDQVSTLGKNSFYYDNSLWFNGLFFYNIGEIKIASYFVWKYWENSIILLVGSPLNIVGERTMQEGIYAPGTHLSWDSVISFMVQNFQTDENNLVGVSIPENADYGDKQLFAKILAMDSNVDSERILIGSQYKAKPHDEMLSIYQKSGKYKLGALDFGLFCAKYLSALPQSDVDILFKVTRIMDLNRPTDLPEWISIFNRFSAQANLKGMERYRRIYLGSPVYTALS